MIFWNAAISKQMNVVGPERVEQIVVGGQFGDQGIDGTDVAGAIPVLRIQFFGDAEQHGLAGGLHHRLFDLHLSRPRAIDRQRA